MKSSTVTKLGQIEHVLLRKSMYIGNCKTVADNRWIIQDDKMIYKKIYYNEGFFKVINEIIDNSIDEYLKTNGKFSTKIDVNIMSDGTIKVVDNGRGISSEKDKSTGKYQTELAFCEKEAGSNWDRDVSVGMNGLGCTLTNFLSESFLVETCDGKYMTKLTCKNNCGLIDIVRKKSSTRGTSVEFKLDMNQFEGGELLDINTIKDILYKRMVELNTIYPKIKLTFNSNPVKSTIWTSFDNTNDTILIERGDIKIFALYVNEPVSDISYVNGIETYRGGTHIKMLKSEISKFFKEKINKKHKIDFKNISGIFNNFLFAVSITNFSKPEFNTQTKTELINPEKDIREFLIKNKFDIDVVCKKIYDKFEDKIDEFVETFNDKKIQKKIDGINKNLKNVKRIAQFMDAIDKDRKDTILFLVEGDSAKSHFPIVRDKHKHGMFPLRGKVLNVYNTQLSKILENKELTDLMNIVGLKIGNKSDTRYYDKIAILTDADVDGNHIAIILMLFFYKYFPHLFHQNRIVKVVSPIIVCYKGNKSEYFYDYGDFLKVQNKYSDWKIKYIKGLGSLNKDEYAKMIMEPRFEYIKIEDVEYLDKMINVLFDKKTSLERRIWLQGNHLECIINGDCNE